MGYYALQSGIHAERSIGSKMSNKNHILTFDETRSLLRCSKNTLRKLLNTGELKGLKNGAYNWLIPETSINEYINKKLSI